MKIYNGDQIMTVNGDVATVVISAPDNYGDITVRLEDGTIGFVKPELIMLADRQDCLS